MKPQNLQIQVPANLGLSSVIRNISMDVFRAAGFSEAWCSRLKLVTDELFMNAVKYGSDPAQSQVLVSFAWDDQTMTFKIADDGKGSRPVTPEELQRQILHNENNQSITKTSGRGLATIAHLWTDQFSVRQSEWGGIEVLFVKKIETTPPPVLLESTPVIESAPSSFLPPGPAITFALNGELDQSAMDHLNAELEHQIQVLPNGGRLLLDCSQVSYINSTFIGHLAAWYKDVVKKGGALQLLNANSAVRDVLNLVGLARVIPIQ